VLLLFVSCGGSLTTEQREKARKAIEEGQIKRVTPAQLTEAALAFAKPIADQIVEQDPYFNDSAFIDSLAASREVSVYALRTGAQGLDQKESEILDAYTSEDDLGNVNDNVQTIGDTLLFTRAITKERPDGSRPFSHAIAIKMSVRTVVNSIKQ